MKELHQHIPQGLPRKCTKVTATAAAQGVQIWSQNRNTGKIDSYNCVMVGIN